MNMFTASPGLFDLEDCINPTAFRMFHRTPETFKRQVLAEIAKGASGKVPFLLFV